MKEQDKKKLVEKNEEMIEVLDFLRDILRRRKV